MFCQSSNCRFVDEAAVGPRAVLLVLLVLLLHLIEVLWQDLPWEHTLELLWLERDFVRDHEVCQGRALLRCLERMLEDLVALTDGFALLGHVHVDIGHLVACSYGGGLELKTACLLHDC